MNIGVNDLTRYGRNAGALCVRGKGRCWSSPMASILPFIPRGVFDDAATAAMGAAFDAACRALHPTGQPEKVVQNAIATRIVVAARKGQCDVRQLRNAALTGLVRTSPAAVE